MANIGRFKKIILTRAIQLIVAQKMRQVDLEKLEQDIELAITKESFNIFQYCVQHPCT